MHFLKKGQKFGHGYTPHPLIRAMPERKRFFSVDVFPNVLQQVHRLFLHCPSLLFQTLSADNVLKAFSILQGTPSKSAELGNNYHTLSKIFDHQYFFNTKICLGGA